jgi:hypothetical protein
MSRLLGDRPLTVTERVRRHRARQRERQAQQGGSIPALDCAGDIGRGDSAVRVLAALGRQEVLLRAVQRDLEHFPALLRRLTELERLVRGDPGLLRAPNHTRRHPLGADRLG